MTRLLALMIACLTLVASPALAQNFPERGTAAVVDQADLLNPVEEAALTAKLEAFEQANERQFVVVTLASLDGYDIADYGYQLGRHWGLGDAENDDGILLIIAPNERKMRIETGYGLEAVLPDGLAFDYIEEMKPYFRDEDYAGGIAHGADRVIAQLELPPEEAAAIASEAQARGSDRGEGGIPFGMIIFWGVIIIFFIIPAVTGKGGRRYRRSGVGDVILWSTLNAIANSGGHSSGGSGGFGGFSGGGGGFSGGGGSFGGGGASGGW